MSAGAGGGRLARRRLVTATVVLAPAATAAACTGEQASGERTATPRNSPEPTPSERLELTPPELRPGHEQLVSEGPREGSRNLGRVTLRKGVNWVDVNCLADRGRQTLRLSLGEGGEFTVDCPSDEVRMSVNQYDLAGAQQPGEVSVEAPDGVTWYASVQAPAK
ncbi:hypothetical protein ACWEJQ_07240 [Streptomyces albidoflavus]